MKHLITNLGSSVAGQEYPEESFQHIQDASSELFDAIVKTIYPNYTAGDVIILYGCVATGTDPGARTISAGAVYYNGEIYLVPAASFTTTGSDVAVGTITTSYLPIDPTPFTDGTTQNVHQDKKIIIAAGASGSGTKNFSLFVNSVKLRYSATVSGQTTSSTSFSDTGLSYTTPNDGYTRNWLILHKGTIQFTSSSGDGGETQILNSTTSTQLDFNVAYADEASTTNDFRTPINLMYYGAIAPNTVIKIQFKSSAGGSINLNNNRFVMIEM